MFINSSPSVVGPTITSYAEGTFTASTTSHNIYCGFKPDAITCYQTDGDSIYIYDSRDNATQYLFCSDGSHVYHTIGGTNARILSIDSDGFTTKQTNNTKTWKWFATKYS